MKSLAVVVVLLFLLIAATLPAAAQGIGLESAGVVTVYPLAHGESGFTGYLYVGGLPVPDTWKIGGARINELIKTAVITRQQSLLPLDARNVYFGLTAGWRNKRGVPVYLGVCSLPLSKVHAALFASFTFYLRR